MPVVFRLAEPIGSILEPIDLLDHQTEPDLKHRVGCVQIAVGKPRRLVPMLLLLETDADDPAALRRRERLNNKL